MNTTPTVLVVHDDPKERNALFRALDDHFDVHVAGDAAAALEIMQEHWVQIAVCHQDVEGLDLLRCLGEQWPDVLGVLLAGADDTATIAASLEDPQVHQCVTCPWQSEALVLTLRNAADLFALRRQNELLEIELKLAPDVAEPEVAGEAMRAAAQVEDDGIVRSKTSCMNAACERLRQVAPFDISVLLTGESGTGKELAARALHNNSLRWEKPFVVENCGALPDELLESELFGCRRGAFTGAVEDRIGLFERASGGTVFLDEIGEISAAFQVKLLRVLQEGEIRPLGASETRRVDIRVIAATNRDLDADVAAGRFREDLYYRLAAVTIKMPPLRDRLQDIPALAQSLLVRAVHKLGKPAEGFTDEALECLQRHRWPGNVRELQNEIQRMLVLSPSPTLGAEYLSSRVLHAARQEDAAMVEAFAHGEGTLKTRIRTLEASILREALVRHHWNKSRAARELGLSRVGLRNKLERYGLVQSDVAMAASG